MLLVKMYLKGAKLNNSHAGTTYYCHYSVVFIAVGTRSNRNKTNRDQVCPNCVLISSATVTLHALVHSMTTSMQSFVKVCLYKENMKKSNQISLSSLYRHSNMILHASA